MWDVFIKLVDLWMAKLVYMLSGSDYRNNTKCVKSCDMLIVEIISYQSVKSESCGTMKFVKKWNRFESLFNCEKWCKNSAAYYKARGFVV